MIDKEYRAFLGRHLPLLKRKGLPFWHRSRHSKHDTLRYCLKKIKILPSDLVAEFGVWKGTTLRMIAKRYKNNRVFGFDSFTGFPDDGRGDWQQDLSLKGELPAVPGNVTLVKGYFAKTLPEFVEQHKGERLAFMHIDCDIYSSTKTVLFACKEMIHPGCIIVFDELLHYPGFLENELLAFYEFVREARLNFEWIAIRKKVLTLDEFLNPSHEVSRFVRRSMKYYRKYGYEQEVALRMLR